MLFLKGAQSLRIDAGQREIFQGKKVLVVGLGLSGLWSARWVARQGGVVTVSEIRPEEELDPGISEELRALGVRVESGGHRKETFLVSDMIILSPGVPYSLAPLQAAAKGGIPVVGELELASRFIEEPLIAVTGTNGKSTVTTLLGDLLRRAGKQVFVGGNIGTPLMAYLGEEKRADFVVVEVSSFQLDTIETFNPFISVILNISPDHLDRYPDYEAYVESKLRIFMNQGPDQYVILNDGDERLASVRLSSGVSVLRYGIQRGPGRDAFIEENKVEAWEDGRDRWSFSLESFGLPGRHNRENLLPLVLAGRILGIEPSTIQETIDGFKGLPHRLEAVGEQGGVIFYNDSKATNVDAAVQSVLSFEKPLVLIAGGRHKGADYEPLVEAARGRVKAAVFLGEARRLLCQAFEGLVPCCEAEDMEHAVDTAFSFSDPGDAVLLAPACSSFDMFLDYKHRGRVFKTAVERLSRG